MGALDVAGGLWLDRKLSELEEKAKKRKEGNQTQQKVYVDYEAQREERRAGIQANYAWLDEVLKTPRMFGYLLETDKMGFYRALAKAKEMFRSLYAERDYKNMMSDNFGNLEVNPEFVEMIEEIYYKEINLNAKIYDLKLARYNDLRDELIARFEGDTNNGFTEEYANKMLGVSRAEMFDKVKRNEFVLAYAIKSNAWGIAKISDYIEYVKEGRAKVSYPLEDKRD